MLCDHVFQERKTSTFLHDSGVFFSDVGQFMSRGWGSSGISVVSLPILISLVEPDGGDGFGRFGDIFEWVCVWSWLEGVSVGMYLALATGHGNVNEAAGVEDTLVGAALGLLLLLLGLDLYSDVC